LIEWLIEEKLDSPLLV
jgi:hypothetical protein